MNGEPTGDDEPGQEIENTAELFPVGPKLSELVAEYRDDALAERLAGMITAEGPTGDFYHEIAVFSGGITAAMESDWQKATGTEEERPLQIRQQVLRQVGQIVLLLDAYFWLIDNNHQNLAEALKGEINELRSALLDEIDQLLDDKLLTHRDYFESIQQKVEGLVLPG